MRVLFDTFAAWLWITVFWNNLEYHNQRQIILHENSRRDLESCSGKCKLDKNRNAFD